MEGGLLYQSAWPAATAYKEICMCLFVRAIGTVPYPFSQPYDSAGVGSAAWQCPLAGCEGRCGTPNGRCAQRSRSFSERDHRSGGQGMPSSGFPHPAIFGRDPKLFSVCALGRESCRSYASRISRSIRSGKAALFPGARGSRPAVFMRWQPLDRPWMQPRYLPQSRTRPGLRPQNQVHPCTCSRQHAAHPCLANGWGVPLWPGLFRRMPALGQPSGLATFPRSLVRYTAIERTPIRGFR